MAASIVVDIKAQITGYQEQIAKIQQALSKIKIDSSLGKELTKELENAQKMLNNLGKNTNIRLSSESGIDQLTDKLENAGEKIRDITQLMGQVKFEDLDVSKLGPEFTDILKKVQELQAALNQGMGDGIQKAINDSETLKKTFTDLGADITKISADSGLELLNTALKGAQEEAANAKAKVEELNGAIEQQSAALQKLEQSPFFANGFNLDSLVQQLTDLGKVSPDKMLDKDAFQNFVNTWKSGVEQLPKELEAQKQKINEILSNLAPPTTIEGARQQFENLSGAIKNILSGTGYNKDSIFGGTTGASFVNNLFKVDESAVNDAKAKIENVFNTFRESFTKAQNDKIQGFLDKGQIDKAAQATITALREGQSKITAEYDKIYNELNNTINEKSTTEAVQTAAETNVASLTQQIIQLETTITDLKQQFEAQRQEIADLKQKLAEAGQKATQGLQDQAKAAGDASAGIMNNAREAANLYKTELDEVQAKEQFIGKIEGVVQRWFSVYAAVRMVSQAVRSVISTVQELDKTITQIAIVTNMTQQDLWGQMKSYTDMARQYATSISGVYEVSQLYYQQGLQTADVMALTEETLKMARISGLDYATATDYMTNAVRSFKMEMQDAQTVVDVYSEIAASSATSTAELATAMSKTASSAQAVGSSFENTTAMMAVMIEATRESAENIGSAMKSIISRYGEMTKDPSKLTDSEGEAMSLNKVDKALQTVGIAIHDAQGQFRDFDDVITELAGKWDTIDKNTQRYIATVMAGNRQQSRFLALVSNGERLAELSEKAANSQDAATLQVLKTMDSIEAKTQQLKTTLQSLYVDSGIENMYKGILDFANNLAKSLSELGTIAGIPIEAIGKIALTFMSLSNTVTTAFGLMRNRVKLQMATLNGELTAQERVREISTLNMANEEVAAIANAYEQRIVSYETMQARLTQLEAEGVETRINLQRQENSPKTKGLTKGWAIGGAALSLAGTAISGYAANLDVEKDRQKKAVASGIGTMTQLIGLGASMGGIWGAAAGAGIGAITGAVQALGIATEETEEKITRLGHAVEATSNKKLQSKDDLQTLVDYKKKYDELAATRNKDAESREEWIKLNNDIAASYPELISQMDAEGNSIVDMTNAYENLLKIKRDVYQQDFLNNIQAELNGLNDIDYVLSSTFEMSPLKRNTGIDAFLNSTDLRSIGEIYQGYQKGGGVVPDTRANADTYASVFGIKNKKELEGFDRQSSGEVLNNYRSQYDQLINLMYEKASEGLSKAAAVEQIMTEHPELEAFSSNLEHFDQSLYNYFLSLNSAITYQQQLINSKISQGNAEWLQALQGITGIEYNDIQFSQLQNVADKKWEEYQEEYAKKIEENPQKYHELGSEVDGKTWSLGDIYSQFIQEELDSEWYKLQVEHLDYLADETINELYKNLGKSNRSSIKLGLGKYANISEEVRQILLDEFDRQYEDTINNFKEHINKLKTTTENIDLQNKLTALQLALPEVFGPEYLNGITTQFENILNNTEISDSHKNLQFDGLMQIYTEISKLDENLRQSALSAAEGADFTSLTGIHDFIKSLEDVGIDLDATGLREIIRNFGQTLNINFETEVQSYIANVTSGLEDFDKALNSASKGMDFKTASELAGKLGKSLTEDFDLRDGQYFFSDFAAIRDKFLQANNDYLNDLKTAQDAEIDKFNKIKAGIATTKGGEIVDNKLWKDFNNQEELNSFLSSNQKIIEDYSGLDISTISNAWQQWHQQAVEGENNFVQWLSDEYGKQYAEAVEAGKAYANQRIASIALSNGNIDAFLEAYVSLGKTIDEEAAKAAFNDGNMDVLIHMFPEFASTLLEKYQSISLDIFDKMINTTEEGSSITVDPSNTRQQELLERLASEQVGLAEKIDKNVYKLEEITSDNIDKFLAEIDASDLTNSEKATERAKAKTAVWDKSLDKLLQDTYKNVDSISQETYEKLISELDLTQEQIKAIFKDNGDNTYTVDVNKLQQIAQKAKESGKEISDETLQMGEDAIQKTADDILKQISDASSLVTKGTTSPEAMQKFVTDFNEATGKASKMQDLFSFSDIADGFTLNAGVFKEYADALKSKVAEGQMSAEWAEKLIEQATNEIRNSIDIKGYLDSDKGQLSTEKLQEQIKNYYDAITESAKILALQDGIIRKKGETVQDYEQRAQQYREEIIQEQSKGLLHAINEGGQTAVDAMRKVSDDGVLSAEEVEAAYRGQVAELQNAFDQLAYKPGAIVSGIAKEILEGIDGFKIKDLGDGSGVIESTGEVVEAYREFYIRLHNTNEATVAELNEAGAKILETRNDTDEALAIDALGDAAHMSYQRLGEILAEKGIELSENYYDEVISKYIEKLGPNQIAITDFSGFAKDILGITDFSSPEYISAFKSYNDSLISLNRQAERNIVEEVNNLSNAQGGDWVNLTQLVSSLSSSVVEKMTDSLEQYGGILDNGILKLDSDANLVAIINSINDYASRYGDLLESDMAQLADAMNTALKRYVSAINSGIKGELTNSGALELQNFAKRLDANLNLQFVQTQNGLKLAQQSATALYFELQKIDSMQAGLTFDALSKSLQETNENYKNISDIGRHILELQEQIESVPVNDARRQQFEQELSLAEQIYEVRSLTDDSSFNFMSNSLPDGFSNPINYWDSWGKAFKSMNEAAKTGQMGIQDFYNIVNEMNNAAKMAGTTLNFMGQELNGDLEGAANLITAGFHHIENIDGSGPKIALENLGANFEVGADAMTGDVDTGIKAVARAQIKMLDSLIAMLEAIVKMQEIQIDTDGNGLIDFDELFSTKGMEKAQQWLDYFTMNFGEVTVDGIPLVEALYKQLSPDELLEFFNELNKIINDPDCDPATIRQKLMDLIQKTFSGKDIEIKDSIFGDLQIDTETMGQELYDKIMDSLSVTDQTVLSEIATEIGKHNEELGKQLQQIIDDNPGINLSQALKIAADLKEHGTIKENTENNTWEALYDGKPIGGSPFSTQEEANNALKDYITEQAKENSPINEKPLEIRETDLMVNGEVRTYQTFYYGDQKPKYLYKGREFSSEEEVMEAVKTGDIDSETDKLTSYEYNGSKIEFSESHGLVVKHTLNADGSEIYEYNGEKYTSKEEFEKIFNANSGETVTTVNVEGNTVTVVISETTNKAHKVEQKEETWTVDGVAVEGDFSSAAEAVKAYEASHPTSTGDTTAETTTTTEVSDTNVVLSVNNVSIKGTEEGAELPITEPLSKVTGTAETLELTTVTSASLSEEITSIPIDNIKLAPQSVDLDTANMPTPDIKIPDISVLSVILKPLLGMIDTSNTQLLGSVLAGLPGDKNLTVATAKAIISAIDLDSANATFGDLAVTLPETKKKVQITDIITGLIQNVQLKTADGTGGGTKTNYDTSSITLSDGTEISIATAVATLQQLSVTLAAGEDGATGGSVNTDGLPTEFDIAAATALLTTLSIAAGEGMAAPDISALLNEDGTYHIQAPGTVELTSTSVTQGAQIGPDLSEVGNSTDAINNALTAAGTFADTYVDAVATAIKNKETLNPIDVSNIIKMDAANFDLSAIKDALGELGTEATTASSEVAAGLATDNSATSNTGATTMGDQYIETLKTALGVASPSTYAIEAGQNVAEGLKQGIETATGPTEAAQTLGDNVIQTLTTALGEETLEVTVPQLAVTPTETTLSQDLEISSINTSEVTVEELVATATSAKYKDNTIELEDIKEGKANITNLTVDSSNLIAGSGLTSLQGLDFSTTSGSLGTLSGYATQLSNVSFGNFGTLLDCLSQASSAAQQVWDYVKQFSAQTFTANIQVQGGDSTINTTENKTTNEVHNITENTETTETHNINENYNEKIDVDTSGAQQSTSQLGGAAASMGSQASTSAGQLKTAQTALNQVGSAAILAKAQINNLKTAISQAGGAAISAKSNIGNLKTAMTGFPNPSKNVADLKSAMTGISSTAAGNVSNLAKAMNSIPTGNKSASVTLKYSVQKSSTTTATGNMGGGSFAKGTSRALVTGTRKTLMGELGPELVVSNGRYFIAGQNGAEFVDLAKDAIVFNHKQTRRLLEQGMIGSRGRPITNETNAISLAKGRIPELGRAAAGEQTKTTTITESISSVSVSPSISDPIKLFSMAKGSIPSMGPALASAAAALAALKELRAMWQSLLDAGAKELGSMAGRDGGGGKGGKSCFVAGTLVRVLDGYKNIEDIQKGDLVLSYNTDKKINEYSEVVATMIHNTTEAIYSLYIEDDIIEATGIHPFFVKRDEKVDWIEAENLLIGDYVLFADGTWHRIDNIEVQILSTTVYNFEVSGNHNYYVGKNSILVHNKKGGGKKPSAGKNKKSPKGKGGKGGGGGGGGGDSEGEEEEIFAPIEYGTITEEIQRWYDLLRQIDKLEQDISYQQALRKKYESDRVANGEKIYSTYQNELALLKNEIKDQKELATLQKSWYDAKRNELANTSYAKIFTYNDEGLQQYTGSGKPGSKKGLDILEHLTERNAKGKYKLTTQEQLKYLKSVGFNLDELRYNDDGTVLISYADALKDNKVAKVLSGEGTKLEKEENGDYTKESLRTIEEKRKDILTQLMENFWSRIDGWRDELDSLYDSYNETATQIQENLAKQNEILQKLVDNEVKVEEDLYKAIESREQTLIDNLKKEQELLKNSTDKFIEGLNKQLSKEKEQYNNQKDQDELTKLQRQLAILQRSGGSATQIRSLQEQIDSKMQEDYFKKQEDSINTIKEAADEQIKRLEKQIDIQSEILEYQKSHGLLWEEVRYIMENWAEEDIASSILKWDKEFKEKSDLQIQEELKEIRERIQIYTEGRDTNKEQDKKFDEYASNLEKDDTANKLLGEITGEEGKKEAKAQAESSAREAYKAALNTGSTEKQAQEQAQTAYNQSLNEYKNSTLNRTKTDILNKENEGKEEKDQKTKSTAETKLNNFIKNDSKLNALSNKKGYYTNRSSAQKTNFQQAYYDNILEQQNNGEEIDYEKALAAAYTKIENDANTDYENGFYLTKNNVATYERKIKNKKATWPKAKPTLSKKTRFKITGIDGNFVRIQAIGNDNNKQYWVQKSTIPSNEIASYNTAKKDNTKIQAGTGGTNEAKNYEDLKKNGLRVSSIINKGEAVLGKNIKYKDVAADGHNITRVLTDNKGKTLKQIKSFHIKSINGLQSTGAFNSVVLDQINDKTLTKAYTMSSKVASKIMIGENSLTKIIRRAIKEKVTGKATQDISYRFVTGGMADFTGPAWLDGTKKRPEAVLNADQTRFLKEDLLGNSSNSLMSIVSALQDSMNSTYTSSVDNSNSVVIENISLNFEAGTISNDYDARRAGDTVVKEILKIARKTGNNSVSRR